MEGSSKKNREELARMKLVEVRSAGHSYIELRGDDEKKVMFFCNLCVRPCYSASVLDDHLLGKLHKKMYESAKLTLLKQNPWPFNDGMFFFHDLAIVAAADRNENLDDENGYRLVIPRVLLKGVLSDLQATFIGVGEIGIRFYEEKGVRKGINRIWCEWLGDGNQNQQDCCMIPKHEFAFVVFTFSHHLGREPEVAKMLLRMKDILDKSKPCRTERKKIYRKIRSASTGMCKICEHKLVPGKDVATLVNMETGRFICSTTNLNGTFLVYHISCLISWLLVSEANKINAEEDTLEKEMESLSLVSQPEVDKQKMMKAYGGLKGYMGDPEILHNCSVGFRFPPVNEETSQGVVSQLKMIRFYRAAD